MEVSQQDRDEWQAPWADSQLAAMGLRSVPEGGSLYCGNCLRMPFAIGNVRHQWPRGSVLRWHIGMTRLGELSDLDMKAARQRTCDEIQGYVSGLKFEYTPNGKTANLIATAVPMDGPSGVLADHEIPPPNIHAGMTLRGRFDSTERFVLSRTPVQGAIDFERTDKHELAHGCGFGHGTVIKSNPAMLEPMYSWALFMYQQRDVEEWQARYGVAEIPKNPELPPVGELKQKFSFAGLDVEILLNPTAAGASANMIVKRDGKTLTLAGSKKWDA